MTYDRFEKLPIWQAEARSEGSSGFARASNDLAKASAGKLNVDIRRISIRNMRVKSANATLRFQIPNFKSEMSGTGRAS